MSFTTRRAALSLLVRGGYRASGEPQARSLSAAISKTTRTRTCWQPLISRARPQWWTVSTSSVRWATASSVERSVQQDEMPVGFPWQVVAAACIQRYPLISREKTAIEVKMETQRDTLRLEKSRLSDFELEEAEYLRKKREREKRALDEAVEGAQTKKTDTSDEFEELQEAREMELAEFQPATRETEADAKGDLSSTQRRLDRMLYLLVKAPQSDHVWQMPQGIVGDGESLVEAAMRELQERSPALQVDFLTGTPSAYLSYNHPPRTPSGIVGSKVFFMKAQYRGGSVQVETGTDHVWVTQEEMRDYVSDDYYLAVAPIITD